MSAIDAVLAAWARGPDHPLRVRMIDACCRRLRHRRLTVSYRHGTRLSVDPCSHIGRHVLYDGIYEASVLDAILLHLTRAGVFVDVGCHVGCFAIPAATQCARVLAIDAFAPMVAMLKHNIALNGLTNVDTALAAVSDRIAEAPLFIAADRQMSSLSRDWPAAAGDPVFVKTTTVAALLHEHEIDRVDVLKIDAEGMSAAIILGAEPVLPRIRTIIFETDSADDSRTLNLLARHGFSIRPLTGGDAANFIATK